MPLCQMTVKADLQGIFKRIEDVRGDETESALQLKAE